jgi:hypothetical protein
MRSTIILPRAAIVTCLLGVAFLVLALTAPPDAISKSRAAQYDYSGIHDSPPLHEIKDALDLEESVAAEESFTTIAEEYDSPHAFVQVGAPEPLTFTEYPQNALVTVKDSKAKPKVKAAPYARQPAKMNSRPSRKSPSPWGAFNKSRVRSSIFSQNRSQMYRPFGNTKQLHGPVGRNAHRSSRSSYGIQATVPRYHRKWWE